MHVTGTIPPKGGLVLMSPQSKREYLAAIVKRYRTASRKIKTVILNEFVQPAGITESMLSDFCGPSGVLFK